MDQPVVSVIIPVYNTEKYLDKCISSIREQTYKNIEILLINDGSSDRSGEICDRHTTEDDRIQVVHISNHGVSHARNLGIQMASGKYLFFVDSDDYIDGEMIAEQVEAMENNCADLCVSELSQNNRASSFCIDLNERCDLEMWFLLKKHLLFGPVVKLYRRDIVNAHRIVFPEDFSYGEDLLFNLEYLRHIERICYVNRCYYHYVRENTQSLSQKVRWNAFENEMVLHVELKKWILERNLMTEPIQRFLADRVVGTASDGIALTYRRDCPWGRVKKLRYIKRIVHYELLAECLPFADTTAYAPWIIRGMRRKNCLLFWLRALKR